MDWFSALIGFAAGLVPGYVFKIAIDSRKSKQITETNASGSAKVTTQSGNDVSGDMAGRDINNK